MRKIEPEIGNGTKMIRDIIIMIPAYCPDEKFISFIGDLRDNGYCEIIVINDGSMKSYLHFFEEAKEKYGCEIVSHNNNFGQGRAYKSGFNYFLGRLAAGGYDNVIGIIQCDCDGQHCIEDINKCADLLRKNPHNFILGVRDFSDKNVPFRSRFGNCFTNIVFKVFCGIDVKDTQSGLKGIPVSFIPILIETPGERFEYASSVLLETKKQGIEIIQFPIHTIYINGNETSHFNPLLDSLRIYSLIFKFLLSSLSAFIVDIVAFTMILTATRRMMATEYIIVSTYLAKIISCVYSFIVNKNFVFVHGLTKKATVIRFIILCAVQATLSGLLTNTIVSSFRWNEVLCKIIIDTILFFASFQVQNRWVFRR